MCIFNVKKKTNQNNTLGIAKYKMIWDKENSYFAININKKILLKIV